MFKASYTDSYKYDYKTSIHSSFERIVFTIFRKYINNKQVNNKKNCSIGIMPMYPSSRLSTNFHSPTSIVWLNQVGKAFALPDLKEQLQVLQEKKIVSPSSISEHF